MRLLNQICITGAICETCALHVVVIPAKAGIYSANHRGGTSRIKKRKQAKLLTDVDHHFTLSKALGCFRADLIGIIGMQSIRKGRAT
jgi:hypothetical protein